VPGYWINSLSSRPCLFPILHLPPHFPPLLQVTMAWMDWLDTWLICDSSYHIPNTFLVIGNEAARPQFLPTPLKRKLHQFLMVLVLKILWMFGIIKHGLVVQELVPLTWNDLIVNVDFDTKPTTSHQYEMPLPFHSWSWHGWVSTMAITSKISSLNPLQNRATKPISFQSICVAYSLKVEMYVDTDYVCLILPKQSSTLLLWSIYHYKLQ